MLLPASAISITIDYTYDTTDFFGAGNPDGAASGALAKAALEAAAQFYSDKITDDFLEISESGTYTWEALFTHPGTGATQLVPSLFVPADTIIIYAGGRSLSGAILGSGRMGAYNAIGNDFHTILGKRGEVASVYGASATEFALWGGSITFDNDTVGQWWYDHRSTSGLAGKNDFYSVALHELGHIMGLGSGDSWYALHAGPAFEESFTGVNATAANGGINPLLQTDHDRPSHFKDGTMSTVFQSDIIQEVAMVPSNTIHLGERRLLTKLDMAALDDIGWDIISNIENGIIKINSLNPSPVTGSNIAQSFYINGSNFTSSSTVTLRDLRTGEVFPNRTIYSQSSNRIEIHPNFTDIGAMWSVEVLNGSSSSGQYQFAVLGSGALTPEISRVTPSTVTGSDGLQNFYISGSNFTADSTATLINLRTGEEFPNVTIYSRTSTQIKLRHDFTTEAANWTAEVSNNGLDSGEKSFSVVAPTEPEPEVTVEPQVTTQRIEYGYGEFSVTDTLPDEKSPGAVGLVITAHGWNSNPRVWADDWSGNALFEIWQYLGGNSDAGKWDLATIDWTEDADRFQPSTAKLYACPIGVQLGQKIRALGYDKVHFIGHSCGSWVIEYAASMLDKESTYIHTTFLDAYVPKNLIYMQRTGETPERYGSYLLGENSHHAEQYYTSSKGLYPTKSTGTPLAKAVNYNIEELHDPSIFAPFDSHSWPHVWYRHTILNNDAFGFGLSPIVGGVNSAEKGWPGYKLPSQAEDISPVIETVVYVYKDRDFSGGHTYSGQGTPSIDYNNMTMTVEKATSSNLPTAPQSFSTTSSLEPEYTAWTNIKETLNGPVNFVRFNLAFNAAIDSGSTLSVYWDETLLSTFQVELMSESLSNPLISLPDTYTSGSHLLSLRLDSAAASSSVAINDFELGYIGPALVPQDLSLVQSQETLVTLSCSTLAGFKYNLQASDDLENWTEYEPGTIGDGQIQQFEHAHPVGHASKFYRISVKALPNEE